LCRDLVINNNIFAVQKKDTLYYDDILVHLRAYQNTCLCCIKCTKQACSMSTI
jgi:hypothetical protein